MAERSTRVWTTVIAVLGIHMPLAAQEAGNVPTGSAVVSGQVVAGDTGTPLTSVSVELLFASDSIQVASGITNPEGRFVLERIPEGTFFLRLASIGYGSVTTAMFDVAAAESRNLGRLVMPVEAVGVEPITVSAERSAVMYEADRTSYIVGVMPGTQGASVTEALGTIPELEVNIDGQVMLRNSPVTIYLNGREAPMDGEALTVFLEQFPADYLAKIEVLDNPSARYDAQGTGGIVNLVTRDGVELGLSGTVFANAGTRGQYGLGARGTLQRGKWTINTGGFLRLSDSEQSAYDLRQNLFVDPEFLQQESWTDRSGLSANVDLDVRYEPTEQSRIFVEGRVAGSGSDLEGLTTTTHLSDVDLAILAYDRSRASDSRNRSFDLATGYQWESDGESEDEFEVEVQLQRGTQWQNSREEIIEEILEGETSVLIPSDLTLEDEDELETELTLEADYARNLGADTELEVGYEFERSTSDNDRLLRLIEDGSTPEMDDRGHDDREVQHSVYVTLQRAFGDVSLQAGLRGEFTDLEFELPSGETFGQDWFDLFPSANLSWRIDDDRHLRLSYSRRVQRPGLSVLNPINTSTDPLTRQIGNPDIEPQFTHSLSANVRWSLSHGDLRLSPYYRSTHNGWARITSVDEQGVSTRTYENLTSSENFGASLTYSLRRRGAWGARVSISVAHEDRNAGNLNERYSGSSLRFSSGAGIDSRVTEDLSAEGQFSYSPATDLPQGRIDARYRADFGLRYRLLDGRGSIRLRVRDPFELQRSTTRLRDLDYVILGRSRQSTRSAEISVSYALGGGGEFRGRGPRR